MNGRAGADAIERSGVEARFCRSGGRQDVLRDVLCRGAQACLAFCEGRDNAHHLVAVIGKADATALGLVDTDLHRLFVQHLARFGVFHLDGEDAAFRRLHFADKCADTLTAFTLLDVNAEVIDGIGDADTYGACEHTTRVACIIATDCNHIVRIPLDEAAICLDAIDALGVPIAVVAVRVFGEGTGLADEFTIEIHLVSIIDFCHVEVDSLLEVGLLEHRLRDCHVVTVPAETVLDLDALRGPGCHVRESFPATFIHIHASPRHVVASTELTLFQGYLLSIGSERHSARKHQKRKNLFHHKMLVLG